MSLPYLILKSLHHCAAPYAFHAFALNSFPLHLNGSCSVAVLPTGLLSAKGEYILQRLQSKTLRQQQHVDNPFQLSLQLKVAVGGG